MSLELAVDRFVGADSWGRVPRRPRTPSELLTDVADDLLSLRTDDADDPDAGAYRSHRDVLRRCRADGVDDVFDVFDELIGVLGPR